MAVKVLGCVQEAFEHDLVLEILVWYVRDSCLDVQNIVYHFVDHSPSLAVFLATVLVLL